jgi:hypothetical protein
MKLLYLLAIALTASTVALAQPSKQSLPASPSDSVVLKCQKQKTCRFHLVGFLTYSPKGVFSVTPKIWAQFTELDKEIYRNLAKIWLQHVTDNTEQALMDKNAGARINPGAPIIPKAAANVKRNLRSVEFLVTTNKMEDGSPGWSEGQTISELEVRK